MKHQSNFKIPCAVDARDYHDFRFMSDFLHQLGLKDLAVEEIGFVEGDYLGVVYNIKNLPSKEDIKSLFKDSVTLGYEFDRLSWEGVSILDENGKIKQ